MNHRILGFVVATAIATPLAAEVKLSGRIQAEYSSASIGNFSRENFTVDSNGTIFNGGPNRIKIDFSESLGGGLKAFGAYTSAFNTFTNAGLSARHEAFVGLRSEATHVRFGQINGIYKVLKRFVDPFESTSLQSRGSAGGMTGSTYLAPVALKDCNDCNYGALNSQINELKADNNINAAEYMVTARKSNTPYSVLSHNGYVTNAVEVGTKFGGFSTTLQGSIDKNNGMNSAVLLGLEYSAENFTVFAAGTYTDLTANIYMSEKEKSNLSNWKIGAQARFASLKIGLQYEQAEIGTMTGGEGSYIMGSVQYPMGNIILGAWVGHYRDKNLDDENALSFAIGAKYNFSKRTQTHLGYRRANSENDFRDENMFVLGIRHAF